MAGKFALFIDCNMLFLLLILLVPTDAIFKRPEDKTHLAASCLAKAKSQGPIQVKCGPTEKIRITNVGWSYDEKDCNQPSEDNTCNQYSTKLGTGTANQCNGKIKCTVPVVGPTSSRELLDEGISIQQSGCAVDGVFLQETVTLNYMFVKYQCITYNFCDAINAEEKNFAIATPDYPELTITNPTCGCNFTTENHEAFYLQGYATCNGTVMFLTEELSLESGQESMEYECKNQNRSFPVILGISTPYSIKLSVDAERSTEDSAYSIQWFHASLASKTRQKDVKTIVRCEQGKPYLRKSVQLILSITIPLAVGILIILIIVYKIYKSRSRKAKDKRAKSVPLRRPTTKHLTMEPVEDMDIPSTHRSRAPSYSGSTKKIKDERTDPEGDVDELGEFAAMLHKKNEEEQRRKEEKRLANMNGGAVTSTLPTRVSAGYPRRSHSIGNLRPHRRRATENDDDDDMPIAKPLSQCKSASQSRTSVRSMKRRAPQPVGPPQAPQPYNDPRSVPNPLYGESRPVTVSRGSHRHNPSQRPDIEPPRPPGHLVPVYHQPYQRDNTYATPNIRSSSTTPRSGYQPAHSSQPPHHSPQRSYSPSQRSYPPSERSYPPSERPYPASERPYPASEHSYPSSERPYPASERPYPPSERSYPPSERSYPPSERPYSPSQQNYQPSERSYPPSERPYSPSHPFYPPSDRPATPTTSSVGSDTEEMPILRPSFKYRPAVAPKPSNIHNPTTGSPH